MQSCQIAKLMTGNSNKIFKGQKKIECITCKRVRFFSSNFLNLAQKMSHLFVDKLENVMNSRFYDYPLYYS